MTVISGSSGADGGIDFGLGPSVTDADGPFDQSLTLINGGFQNLTGPSVKMQSSRAHRNVTLRMDGLFIGESGGEEVVLVANAVSGNIAIDSAASLTAHSGDGIKAITQQGAVTVAHSGFIQAANGHGIFVDAGANSGGTDPSSVVITNVNLEPELDIYKISALYGITAYAGVGTASVDNQGKIEAKGHGIFAGALEGASSILNSGSITTSDGFGVWSSTQVGNIDISNSGTIEAVDDQSLSDYRDGFWGLRAQADLSGDIRITNTETGKITALNTDGNQAESAAVYAKTSAGLISVENAGEINGRFALTVQGAGGVSAIINSGYIVGQEGAVLLDSSSNKLINSGTITTASGVTIRLGENASLVRNSGTIAASSSLDTAISFGSGNDRLILEENSNIVGAVDGGSGVDTLQILATGNRSFDVGQIGGTAQYRNFDKFEKTGSGTLVLTDGGGGTAGMSTWRVGAGTLAADSDVVRQMALAIDSGATLKVTASAIGRLEGVLSGSGTFEKEGNDTLDIVGDSRGFAGSTKVTSGALNVSGFLGNSIEVLSGATLQGNGYVGDVTIAAGGTLVGAHQGTLHLASLAMDSDARLNVSLAAPSATELFNITGPLTLNGTLSVIDAGGFGTGLYRLVSYMGTLSGGGLSIDPQTVDASADVLSVQTSIAGQVNLIVGTGGGDPGTPSTPLTFWDGGDIARHNNGKIDGGSGLWTATANNWANVDGTVNGPLTPVPAFAVFAGSGGAVQADASAGALSVTGMQFASNGYTITGNSIVLAGPISNIRVGDNTAAGRDYVATVGASLTGDAQLVKTDLGTLILTGANSYTGGTRVEAGILQGNASSIRGDLANMATTIFEQNVGGTFAGSVSGSGDLIKRGAADLILTGDSGSYAGNTTISQGKIVLTGALAGTVDIQPNGALQVGDNGTSGELLASTKNDGTLIFARSDDYDYTGALSGTGSLVKRGKGLLILSGANSYTGSTIIEDGLVRLDSSLNPTSTVILDRGVLDLNSRDQTIAGLQGASGTLRMGSGNLVINQSIDGTFGGNLEGNASFTKIGSATLNMTGTSSFAGTTFVNAGKLAVNGVLAGQVVVNDGGLLGGNGTVGSFIVRNRATAAPGNSIGVIHVNGTALFEAGSTYEMEIDAAGRGDLIAATGAVTIQGGTVKVLAAPGDYKLLTDHIILTSDVGVTGTFSGATSNLAFLTPSLNYEAKAVKLRVARNDITFASVARTDNQRAAAMAVDQFAADNPIYGAILPGSVDEARQAFDQLSGELHATARTLIVQEASRPREAIYSRVDPNLPSGLWVQALGSRVNNDSDVNAGKLAYTSTGLLIGLDRPIADSVRVGIGGGYTHSSGDIAGRASHVGVDGGHAIVYLQGGRGPLRILAGASYSWSEIDTRRSVGIRNFQDTLTGQYTGDVIQGFGRVGYAIPVGGGKIEPFGSLVVSRERIGSFQEQGGGAALAAGKDSRTVVYSTLGVGFETPFVDHRWALRARGGWDHGFNNLTSDRVVRFASGQQMQVEGSSLSRNTGVMEAAIVWRPADRIQLWAGYNGRLGARGEDHGARVSLNWTF
ncbi:autotransporter domain-containing protein [Sphingobium sp. B11D3A]|uniref:autotransporter domain-containing protein n=1 Tax=Sphingobium sp. B11D3A TaxID=2940574 RepID=UPI002224B2B1|nr:autotransporter domain-containing protein [Sphingobium sp. B11D3A]MCW2393545.1 autotransporter-associated beta strand protein [Sphingobium sp. B11D3A]